tara:strand:- start:215 stop:334 length:120 start_codon:yes stop_codon:yes gene_type:complete
MMQEAFFKIKGVLATELLKIKKAAKTIFFFLAYEDEHTH